MESCYAYIGELDADFQQEIMNTYQYAVRNFSIRNTSDGRAIAKQVREIVDELLSTKQVPDGYEDMEDATVALGVLFGQALCIGYGWSWKAVGENSSNFWVSVVSPKEYYFNTPLHYLNKIMSGKNIGLDGENDNTILLLYNMLADIDAKPGDKKLIPMA